MALAIPRLWEVCRLHELWAVLVRAAGIGLVASPVLAAAFALFNSGESSVLPLDVANHAIWLSVFTTVSALNGTTVGLLISWLQPEPGRYTCLDKHQHLVVVPIGGCFGQSK